VKRACEQRDGLTVAPYTLDGLETLKRRRQQKSMDVGGHFGNLSFADAESAETAVRQPNRGTYSSRARRMR